MVTAGALRAADPDALRAAAERWERCADAAGAARADLDAAAADLRRAWSGAGADAADSALRDVADRLDERVARLAAVPVAARAAADGIAAGQGLLAAATAVAGVAGLRVDDDGAVRPAGPGPLATGLQGVVDAALALAADADRALAEHLHADGPDTDRPDARPDLARASGTAPPRSWFPAVPPRTTSPAAVAAWWRGLTPAERGTLVAVDPVGIGALDGVPLVSRDRANRAVLASERDGLRLFLDRHAATDPARRTRADTAAASLAAQQLAAISELERRLQRPAGRPRALLVHVDGSDLGRAVVAVGDVDHADNVVAFVPGTGAQLARLDRALDDVETLVDAAGRADPSATTAGLAWVGYDAPQSIPFEATRLSYAERAAPALDRFLDGLRATQHDLPARTTLVGHSYGSTVVGVAARDAGLAVDELVLVGSPGVGVDRAEQLGVGPAHVWATAAAADPILLGVDPGALTGPVAPTVPTRAVDPDADLWHGNDPTDADFGGRVFASDPGSWRDPVDAHLAYLRPGSTTVDGIAAIVTGRVTAAAPTG